MRLITGHYLALCLLAEGGCLNGAEAAHITVTPDDKHTIDALPFFLKKILILDLPVFEGL